MALGGKKKVRSSNELIIENDDESVKSGFEDAREIPVSKTPNHNISSGPRSNPVDLGPNPVVYQTLTYDYQTITYDYQTLTYDY